MKTKASIVAMSGAIMPEPLAMPLIVTGQPSIVALRVASLGKVSVVMIASAAAFQPPGRVAAVSLPRRSTTKPSGSASPITPVEAT